MPGKQLQNGTYEIDYKRAPDQKTRWEALRDCIHDPVEGTYCGHTGKKWDLIAKKQPFPASTSSPE